MSILVLSILALAELAGAASPEPCAKEPQAPSRQALSLADSIKAVLTAIQNAPPPAEPQWLSEVRSSIIELSRPVQIYHWATREKIGVKLKGSVNPKDSAVRRYIRRATAWRFKNLQDPTLMAGEGVYYSVDPFTSREYGGKADEAALLETTLDEGTRLLFWDPTQGFSPKALGEIEALGCPNSYGLRSLCGGQSGKCGELCNQVLKQFKLAGIIYGWHKSALCDTYVAVVLTDPALAGSAKSNLYVSDIPSNDALANQRQMISHAWNRLGYTGDWRIPPWGKPEISEEAIGSYKTWTNNNLLGCSPDRFKEDRTINYHR